MTGYPYGTGPYGHGTYGGTVVGEPVGLRSVLGQPLITIPNEAGEVFHAVIGPSGQVDSPDLGNWEADESAPGGMMGSFGDVDFERIMDLPDVYTEGAVLRSVHVESGAPVFYGWLQPPPRIPSTSGRVTIKADGPGQDWEILFERLLYELRYPGAFVPRGSEGFGPDGNGYYVQGEERIQLSTDGALRMNVAKGSVFTDGDTNGWILHAPGLTVPFRRVAGHLHATFTGANFELRILAAVGPDGPLQFVASRTFPSGGPLDLDFDIPIDLDGVDLVNVEFHRVGGGSPANDLEATITQLRVDAIAMPGDEMGTSAGIADLAGRVGHSPAGVQGEATNFLPLDVTGAPASEARDRMSLLVDWRALSTDWGFGPVVDYGPWTTRTWRLVDPEFPVDPVSIRPYDSVSVPYLRSNGKSQGFERVRAEVPLRKPRDFGKLSLDDPQPNLTNARTLGASIVAYLRSERYAGRGTVTELMDERGNRRSSRLLHAGDTVTLPGGASCRVKTVQRTTGGETFELDDELAVMNSILGRRHAYLARRGLVE